MEEAARVERDALPGTLWVATRLSTAADSASVEECGRVELRRRSAPGFRGRFLTTEISHSVVTV